MLSKQPSVSFRPRVRRIIATRSAVVIENSLGQFYGMRAEEIVRAVPDGLTITGREPLTGNLALAWRKWRSIRSFGKWLVQN